MDTPFQTQWKCVACKAVFDPLTGLTGSDDDHASKDARVVCGCGQAMLATPASFVQAPAVHTVGEQNYAAFNALVAIAKQFIARVEAGSAHSLTTYKAMKDALDLMPDKDAVLVVPQKPLSAELESHIRKMPSIPQRVGDTINLNF